MKLNRVTALFLGLVLAFSLAACGQGASSASSASSSAASSAAAESKTEEQLLAEENEILSANDALWALLCPRRVCRTIKTTRFYLFYSRFYIK